jgi:hypothetical protein
MHLHQSAVSDYVGGEDGRKLASNFRHRTTLLPRALRNLGRWLAMSSDLMPRPNLSHQCCGYAQDLQQF